MVRHEAVIHLTGGVNEIDILAPLPASLTRDEVQQALERWQGGPLDFGEWLSDRLFKVTGRRYKVESDPMSWEHGEGGAEITYEAVRIADAPPEEGAETA